jgi:ADP-ribose pyrophosphatase
VKSRVGKASETLPAPPAIAVAVARDRAADAGGASLTGGFLNLRRLEVVARYPDGTESAPFRYDLATRAALDAVVIAAHFRGPNGPSVYLRSAVRPPCALREIPPLHDGSLWELPAGLIEPGEDPVETAARELEEELGFRVAPSAMRDLGGWTFPSPGVIGERHIFFAVEVDPAARGVPTEDGSALERAAGILAVPVEEALAHCRSGAIRDAKTELGLRRLAEEL